MADPQHLFAKLPQRAGRMSSLVAGDASTVIDSELTADTSPGRYFHSHDGVDGEPTAQYEGYARITGLGVDYTDGDDVTFPGFNPMRHYLTREAAHYLVSEHRWCNEGDSVDIVGQKNVIVIFVCIATMEEFLVDEAPGYPAIRPFKALMDTLGISQPLKGRPRSYKFLWAIRNAFVSSRSKVTESHLENGLGPPPEPEDLPGLGRMLLDVMDRHIAFMRTKKPLVRLDEPIPLEELFKLRLEQVKNQLRDRKRIGQCFITFVPTIPAHQQTPWPRVGMATSWKAAQAKLIAEHSELAVNLNPSKLLECRRPAKPKLFEDAQHPSEVKPVFSIPGIPADGLVCSLQPASDSPARCPDSGPPDPMSGLRLFKTAVGQVHRTIRDSRDSVDFRNFIGQIEHDIKQFHAELQVGLALPIASPAGATGILGSELNVLLERRHICSLMKIGLGLIRKQWNEQYLTNDSRQKILVEVMEGLRMIEDAADQVCSNAT